jgi:hypothetical protein
MHITAVNYFESRKRSVLNKKTITVYVLNTFNSEKKVRCLGDARENAAGIHLKRSLKLPDVNQN